MTNSNASKGGSAAGADNSSMHSSMLGSRVAGQGQASVAVKSEGLPAVGGQLSVKSGDTAGPTGYTTGREKVPNFPSNGGLTQRPYA